MASIKIKEDSCKGCEMCVNACPKHLIVLNKEKINAKGYHPAMMTDQSAASPVRSCVRMSASR